MMGVSENMNMIIKRDGSTEVFDKGKIVAAIEKACLETEYENDIEDIKQIADEIADENELHFNLQGRWLSVENVNDLCESKMMAHGMFAEAKRFIIYRNKHKDIRQYWKPYRKFKYLSRDFLKQYAGNPDPFDNELSKVTFYRTYSRFIPHLNRRETWLETNARVADFIVGLDPDGNKQKAEELFESLFNFKVMSSGRVRWLGGTKLAEQNFQSLFNCAYITLDNVFNLVDLQYNLMLGAGVGLRMTFDDISKIAPLRNDIEVINKDYKGVSKNERQELTTTSLHNNSIMEIIVGDSRQGWIDALRIYLEILSNYKRSSNNNVVQTILFNYDNVRPQGERLKTIGGFASGSQVLADLFYKIKEVVDNSDGEKLTRNRVKLEPVDYLDIVTKIADIVRVGGTRRSAILLMLDENDYKSINAKQNLYKKENGKWSIDEDIAHRQMSNNSVAYYEKPSRKELHEAVERLKISAEPSFINMEEMRRRKPNAQGLNPLT